MLVYEVKAEDRFKLSTSSTGNQVKWNIGGLWLKADSEYCREGIAEALVSTLGSYIRGIDFVDYSICKIVESAGDYSIVYMGCVSNSYKANYDTEITVYRLLSEYRRSGKLSKAESRILSKGSAKEYSSLVADICARVTNLGYTSIRGYFSSIVKLDAIILNEDRHLNNISFLKDRDGCYRFSPIFDNGYSLLVDYKMYPTNVQLPYLMRRVKSKTFSSDFSKQLKCFEDLEPLCLDYRGFMNRLENSYCEYDEAVFKRAKLILKRRLEMLKGEVWYEL